MPIIPAVSAFNIPILDLVTGAGGAVHVAFSGSWTLGGSGAVAVPEPGMMALFGAGALVPVWRRRARARCWWGRGREAGARQRLYFRTNPV
jgi:hypothetical protein